MQDGNGDTTLSSINIAKPKSAPVLNEAGCVAVAESMHCPPQHHVVLDTAGQYDLPIGFGHGG